MKTILIVDDEFGIVDILSEVFEDEGYRVVTAANGKQGLEQIAEVRPDLVILDVMMPVLDGLEVLRRLRSDAASRDLEVIVMSAAPPPRGQEKLLSNVSGFLRKPFDLRDLLKMVRLLLDSEQQAR
ncbi:MAG TPA: response regulator [Actinomycetota bacterium]|jgi:CheY-like chemotaxis protein